MDHIWRWYCELGGARTNNGFGLNPLSFTEISAWAALRGIEPTVWEVGLLKRLDGVTLAHQKNTSLTGEPEPDIEVAIDDTEGVRSVFESLKARAAAKFGKR